MATLLTDPRGFRVVLTFKQYSVKISWHSDHSFRGYNRFSDPSFVCLPRLLTSDDSERCLELFKRNKKDFLRRYVTMDETWIHHYTLSGQQLVKAGKIMASVFWDAHGILFIDYLEKGKTINSEYYMALLD
ncbi:hypothetical protein ACFW04_014654 [Cataglyphis niger]